MIREKIKLSGYSIAGLARNLGIEYRTIQRWLNLDGIEKIVKFLELLKKLNISQDEFLNEYYKKNPCK